VLPFKKYKLYCAYAPKELKIENMYMSTQKALPKINFNNNVIQPKSFQVILKKMITVYYIHNIKLN